MAGFGVRRKKGRSLPTGSERDRCAIVRAWWNDPVDYRWLLRTLAARSADWPVRIVVGAGGAVMVVISVLTWISPAGPHGTAGHIVFAFVTGGATLWALRWWLGPWPGENESLLLIGAADLLVVSACLMDQDRVYGSIGALLLVVTGGYVSVFHSPRALTAHAVFSLVSVIVLAARLAGETGDVALAVAIVLIMAVAIVVVLPTVHFCYWVLRTDALTDALTALLNRRGLDYYLSGRFGVDDGRAVCAMVIDLDDFKAVNDTYGHSAGDDILVRAAARLRACADGDTLVARSGGEEFAVLAHLDPAAAQAAAERVCRAIATMTGPHTPVTASVGVAAFEHGATADDLLRCADAAMYQAKQLGGNTVVLAGRAATNPVSAAPRRGVPRA
ncbi:GGDEF domain-containing protein [Nocardia otitidiscaviarum]|nr:GGDEF domain-containing protein [Nocardia otitidiscaviarum]MBF6482974.1 GGDEF domain-containing protein [Nocardia otitidiscaviarum]